MRMMKGFNETVDYIESTLSNEKDEKKYWNSQDIRIPCLAEFFLF